MGIETFRHDNEFIKKEEAEYKSPAKGIDGADVGGLKPQDKANKSSEKKENTEGDKKEPQIIASIQEMQKKNTLSKVELSKAIENNPDWPPKSENPESAQAETDALEKSLNAFA